MAKYYDLNIPGSEVQRRLDLASHNVLAFDGILDVPVTASDELITSAESYQILYAPNGGRGEMLMSIGGTYYRNFRLQSSGKTYLDSSWYNEDGQIRKDRLFLNGDARDIYAYAAGSFGKVERDGTDGITPHIDPTTKHWMIGDEDTGIVAEGQDGQDGVDGTDGQDGKSAFDIWLENGHSGNISDFLAWMKDTSSMLGPKFAETTADCLMVSDTPTLYFVPNGTTFNVYLADSDGQGINAHSLATGVPGDITNYAGIYDISQDKAVNGVPATYGDLSEALGAITEDSKKKGGMTVKYLGTDGKYHQYRYLLANTDAEYFEDEDNWEADNNVDIVDVDNESDLEFSDNEGNVLMRAANGDFETKNFNSAKSQQNTGERDYNEFSASTDYAIGDIVRKDGLLYKFISEHEAGAWNDNDVVQTSIAQILSSNIPDNVPTVEDTDDADLEFSDKEGNVIGRFNDGDIETKNFNSKNYKNGDFNRWKGKKWYAFGTSITNINNEGKYAIYLKQISDMILVNKGHSGGGITSYSDESIYNDIMQSDLSDADLITLECGANDAGAPLGTVYDGLPNADVSDNSTFCGALNLCIRHLQATTNAQIVIICSPTSRYKRTDTTVKYNGSEQSGEDNHTVLERNEMMRKVCMLNSCYYIQSGCESGLGYARMNASNNYNVDNIHQTNLGGYNFAQAIWSKLKDIPLFYTSIN